MFSLDPNEEQKMLVEAAKRYAANDLRPAAHDADESGQLPQPLIDKGWELGVLQASIPEAYGGFGDRSAVTGLLAAEELGYGDLAGSLAIMAPSTFAISILVAGTEEQKSRWLPSVVEAEWRPYVAALVEPAFDFYAGAMQTAAVRENGNYVLNGRKCMVPFADKAPAMLVFAMLEERPQAFIVPATTPGVTVGDREKLLGIGALPTHPVKLEDVRLPAELLLGGNQGADLWPALAASQVAVASLAVGVSRAALDYSLSYAKEREVWGAPIAQKQSVAFMLAEMATEIEAIRLLVWEAAWMLDRGQAATKEAHLAMVGACDMAMMVTDRAVQILGGHGYIREHPVELWMRNGRGFPTYTGLAMV